MRRLRILTPLVIAASLLLTSCGGGGGGSTPTTTPNTTQTLPKATWSADTGTGSGGTWDQVEWQ